MSMAIRLFLGIFTVYRLALLLTREDGAFMVFGRIRHSLSVWAADAKTGGFRWTLAELFHCPHCVGVWIAVPVALISFYPSTLTDILLAIFALAGAQSLMTAISEGNDA